MMAPGPQPTPPLSLKITPPLPPLSPLPHHWQPGDVIRSIDGKHTTGLTQREVKMLLLVRPRLAINACELESCIHAKDNCVQQRVIACSESCIQ